MPVIFTSVSLQLHVGIDLSDENRPDLQIRWRSTWVYDDQSVEMQVFNNFSLKESFNVGKILNFMYKSFNVYSVAFKYIF